MDPLTAEHQTTDSPPQKPKRQRKSPLPKPDKQPRQGMSPPETPTPGSTASEAKTNRFVEEWTATYASIGMLVRGADPYAGDLLIQGAPTRAKELDELCKAYPEIRKWLRGSKKATAVIAFATGHGLMLFAILAAHKLVPTYGIVPGPEVYQAYKQSVSKDEAEMQYHTNRMMAQDVYNLQPQDARAYTLTHEPMEQPADGIDRH